MWDDRPLPTVFVWMSYRLLLLSDGQVCLHHSYLEVSFPFFCFPQLSIIQNRLRALTFGTFDGYFWLCFPWLYGCCRPSGFKGLDGDFQMTGYCFCHYGQIYKCNLNKCNEHLTHHFSIGAVQVLPVSLLVMRSLMTSTDEVNNV